MTGSLFTTLKKNDIVHIKVDSKAQGIYFPVFLHDMIGTIWDIDDEHIYIIGANRDMDGKSYMSGPHRYCWGDITVERI